MLLKRLTMKKLIFLIPLVSYAYLRLVYFFAFAFEMQLLDKYLCGAYPCKSSNLFSSCNYHSNHYFFYNRASFI